MKRKTTTIILVIIFLMGFSVLLYPVVSSYVNQMDATKADWTIWWANEKNGE